MSEATNCNDCNYARSKQSMIRAMGPNVSKARASGELEEESAGICVSATRPAAFGTV